MLRLAALLHDIGKPATRRFEPGGGVSFHHHEVVGAKLVRKRLRALRFHKERPSRTSPSWSTCTCASTATATGEWTDSAVRRYVTDAGPLLPRLHRLIRADCTTRNRAQGPPARGPYDDLEERIAALLEHEELDAVRPDLDGNAIMALLGIPPGPLRRARLQAPARGADGRGAGREGRRPRAAAQLVGRAARGAGLSDPRHPGARVAGPAGRPVRLGRPRPSPRGSSSMPVLAFPGPTAPAGFAATDLVDALAEMHLASAVVGGAE